MNKPYTGITGFMSRDEVEKVLACFPKNSHRLFMVGVLASTTTVMGDRPTRFPGRYPVIDDIAGIFSPHPLAFNVIHFNDKTGNSIQILDQMLALTHKGGKNFHGFQLNMKWPDPDILNSYRIAYPQKKIILQVGGGAFRAVGSSPARMARRIREEYMDIVDYILIDPSGGVGKEFDVQTTRLCLRALEIICPGLNYGVAGGLCHDNLNELLLPIAKEFSDVSIDAEGNLRDPANDDILNVKRAVRFAQKSNKLLGNI